MTLAEKGMLSAEVVLTGFVVVFAVLILLIALIMVYSAIVRAAENSGKKKAAKNEKKKAESGVVGNSVVNTSAMQTNGIPDDVVAVISAAVYSMFGSEKVKITNIKKSKGVRSIWASAGVFENTRPF